MTYGGYGVSIKKPPSVSAVLLYLRIRGINISQTEKQRQITNPSTITWVHVQVLTGRLTVGFGIGRTAILSKVWILVSFSISV